MFLGPGAGDSWPLLPVASLPGPQGGALGRLLPQAVRGAQAPWARVPVSSPSPPPWAGAGAAPSGPGARDHLGRAAGRCPPAGKWPVPPPPGRRLLCVGLPAVGAGPAGQCAGSRLLCDSPPRGPHPTGVCPAAGGRGSGWSNRRGGDGGAGTQATVEGGSWGTAWGVGGRPQTGRQGPAGLGSGERVLE